MIVMSEMCGINVVSYVGCLYGVMMCLRMHVVSCVCMWCPAHGCCVLREHVVHVIGDVGIRCGVAYSCWYLDW